MKVPNPPAMDGETIVFKFLFFINFLSWFCWPDYRLPGVGDCVQVISSWLSVHVRFIISVSIPLNKETQNVTKGNYYFYYYYYYASVGCCAACPALPEAANPHRIAYVCLGVQHAASV